MSTVLSTVNRIARALQAKNSLNFKDIFVELWCEMYCLWFVIY